ncbi:MAG: YmaF family protein [Clostridia bacterium]|nr:YmaF family protein [Clostridia bacterium]
MHTHRYVNTTSYDDGHRHGFKGVTSCSSEDPAHIHYMVGTTTYEDGHTHRYRLQTSPAIIVNGQHYHLYCGVTTVDDEHLHSMDGAVWPFHLKELYCNYPNAALCKTNKLTKIE